MTAEIAQRFSIMATLTLIAAMIALYRLDALLSPLPAVIFLQILALKLMFWARWNFGRRSFHFSAQPTSEKLITHGIYKYIRHPIYSAIWLFSWAGVSVHLSMTTVILALTVLAALLIRIVCEETCLQREFPDDYPVYAEKTARLIPFIL